MRDKLAAIFGAPKYVREVYDHEHYCDGAGEILEVSVFYPFPSRTRPCMYCRRMERVRERKRKQRALTDGEGEEA